MTNYQGLIERLEARGHELGAQSDRFLRMGGTTLAQEIREDMRLVQEAASALRLLESIGRAKGQRA